MGLESVHQNSNLCIIDPQLCIQEHSWYCGSGTVNSEPLVRIEQNDYEFFYIKKHIVIDIVN